MPDTMTIRIKPEDRAAIEAAAKRRGITPSEWVRRVIARGLAGEATAKRPEVSARS